MMRSDVARTNIEIDDELVARAMELYSLPTKRAAVDYALRRLVGDGEPGSLLDLKGIGWEGDLTELRRGRFERPPRGRARGPRR